MTLAPAAPAERIESIDILRGLALFGVLLENMQHFVSPTYAAFVASPEADLLDRAGLWMIRFTCDNKVYLLFSFLFGYGIAMQFARAAATGARFIGIHLWRMAILLLIGLAHMLVWTGDILSTFAVLGALLLLLRPASDRVLGATCVGFLAAPSLALALLAAWADLTSLRRRSDRPSRSTWRRSTIRSARAASPSPCSPSAWPPGAPTGSPTPRDSSPRPAGCWARLSRWASPPIWRPRCWWRPTTARSSRRARC